MSPTLTRAAAALLAAPILLAVPAGAQDSPGMSMNMLTASLGNELTRLDLPADALSELSIERIGEVKKIVESDLPDSTKRDRLRPILAE